MHKFERGQLVAVKESIWHQGKFYDLYTLGVVLRLYKISALVRTFEKNESHVHTVRFKHLVPAQIAFKWMKRFNARLVDNAYAYGGKEENA